MNNYYPVEQPLVMCGQNTMHYVSIYPHFDRLSVVYGHLPLQKFSDRFDRGLTVMVETQDLYDVY